MIRSIFQFPSGRKTEPPKTAPDSAAPSVVITAERPGNNAVDTAPDGLIPASQLPSATDVLADLFREDGPSAPAADAKESTSAFILSARTAAAAAPAPVPPVEPELAPEAELPEPVSDSPAQISGEFAPAEVRSEEPLIADPEIPDVIDRALASEPALPAPEPLPAAESPE